MFKVTKSEMPAGDFKYTDKAVKEQIKKDFFHKCYLCEEKTPRHLEVEHFYPQSSFPEKKHDWDNLICICEKCNKIRPKKINTGEEDAVLNPCKDDVEKLIQLRYNCVDYSVSVSSGAATTIINNTIGLLHRIHNGADSLSYSFIDLRKLIAAELTELEEEINNLSIYNLEAVFTKRIQKRLSRQSAFTAIKKTFILENYPAFKNLFD